jgi:lactate dehydrogenase-like 2-hydroxyacid dehydrogenase
MNQRRRMKGLYILKRNALGWLYGEEEQREVESLLDMYMPPLTAEDALPNVVLTPHIAGSLGNERRRMGRVAVEELRRYCRNEPLRWRITREMAERLA